MEHGTVRVRVFGGDVVKRRVLAEYEDLIVICTEEEYRLAAKERREPLGVGFRREFIVRD